MDLALDASALIAMIREEPGYAELVQKIQTADRVVIGSPTVLEAAIALNARTAGHATAQLFDYLDKMGADVVPFTEDHHLIAFNAFLRFGKGHHPARLNFGDCMSYAIATVANLPLLYVGDDFSQTDIEAA